MRAISERCSFTSLSIPGFLSMRTFDWRLSICSPIFLNSSKKALTTSTFRLSSFIFAMISALFSVIFSSEVADFADTRRRLSLFRLVAQLARSRCLLSVRAAISAVMRANRSFSFRISSSERSSPSCIRSMRGASPFSTSLPSMMSFLNMKGIVKRAPSIRSLPCSIRRAISTSPSLVSSGSVLIPFR